MDTCTYIRVEEKWFEMGTSFEKWNRSINEIEKAYFSQKHTHKKV